MIKAHDQGMIREFFSLGFYKRGFDYFNVRKFI